MPNELTNPNNVVTEERLAQFYQQILPYLGGMPDVLANKFNRADLYSTDEKLIGRWIDGKPLYQITLTNLDYGNSSGSETNVSSTNLPIEDGRIDQIINFTSMRSSDKSVDYAMIIMYNSGANKLKYYAPITRAHSDILILQYTKTTDSAVEIGDDTDYSTTEKIVGTWIDGKPIYEKTVDCGVLPNAATKDIAHGISNLGYVINAYGFSMTNDRAILLPIPFTYISAIENIGLGVTSTNIQIVCGTDRSSLVTTYITILYTKTS